MNYFKYFHPKRIDDLGDQHFRFSQSRVVNDPFESQPYFNAPAEPDEILRGFLKTILELSPSEWGEIRDGLGYEGQQSDFGSYFEEHPEEIPELIKFLSPIIMKDITPKYQDSLDRVGMFPMSEVWDNLLMWAHYSDHHKGFVIQFDPDHSFFSNPGEPGIGFTSPARIHYRDRRPIIPFSKMTEIQIFLTKSTDWIYEQEWRYLKFLDNPDRIQDDPNNPALPICLYHIPPTAVLGLILGCNSSNALKSKALNYCKKGSPLEHASVRVAVKDNHEYFLREEILKA